MKASEFREMTAEELQVRHRELEEELFNLRLRHSMRQVENPLQLHLVRRDIARCLTVLREKGLEAESTPTES
jgi:large subunit ribosomal protein L29